VLTASEETCDDGNELTETECPYGTATCTSCDAKCELVLTLTGNVCGDGLLRVPEETCDDGNVIAGDGCNATCTGP
jgi:cysteine-rich repeat protein